MESQDVKAQLKDFGFNDDQIIVALKHSANKSVEGLVQWISDHPEIEELILKETALVTENPKPADSDKLVPEETTKPSEPQGKSISEMVNQEWTVILEGMGYSKNVREKALLMSGNRSVEAALEWI